MMLNEHPPVVGVRASAEARWICEDLWGAETAALILTGPFRAGSISCLQSQHVIPHCLAMSSQL